MTGSASVACPVAVPLGCHCPEAFKCTIDLCLQNISLPFALPVVSPCASCDCASIESAILLGCAMLPAAECITGTHGPTHQGFCRSLCHVMAHLHLSFDPATDKTLTKPLQTLTTGQVKANGLIVFVPKYGIEAPVYLTARGADGTDGAATNNAAGNVQALVLDEEHQVVSSHDGSLRFAVFDAVGVRIEVQMGAAGRRSLALSLVPRDSLALEDLVG